MNRFLPGLVLGSLIVLFGIRLYFSPPTAVKKSAESPEVRGVFARLIKSWLVGDEGALATGILLGGGGDLSSRARLAYRRVGMSHVVAASGYNVTMVGGMILVLGKKFLDRKQLILFVIVSVLLYMYLAGMTASIVRAGIMAIATYVAVVWGRPTDAKWTLALVTLGMLIVNPAYIDDVGFLLSVTATWGVLESSNITPSDSSSYLKRGIRLFFDDFKTSFYAQLFTLPIILHYFGQISVVSPIANALLLWTVPIVMQVVAVSLGVGLIWSELGQLISYLAWPLLRLMNQAVLWIASWPWAAFEVNKISWGWVAAYYGLLVLILYRHKWANFY